MLSLMIQNIFGRRTHTVIGDDNIIYKGTILYIEFFKDDEREILVF